VTLLAAGGPEWRGQLPSHGRSSPVGRLRAGADAQNILNIAVRFTTSRRNGYAPLINAALPVPCRIPAGGCIMAGP